MLVLPCNLQVHIVIYWIHACTVLGTPPLDIKVYHFLSQWFEFRVADEQSVLCKHDIHCQVILDMYLP